MSEPRLQTRAARPRHVKLGSRGALALQWPRPSALRKAPAVRHSRARVTRAALYRARGRRYQSRTSGCASRLQRSRSARVPVTRSKRSSPVCRRKALGCSRRTGGRESPDAWHRTARRRRPLAGALGLHERRSRFHRLRTRRRKAGRTDDAAGHEEPATRLQRPALLSSDHCGVANCTRSGARCWP